MFLAGGWHRLKPTPEALAQVGRDPVDRLPVTLLHRNIIEPIFGVTDPRRDKRIDFVGGGRGLGELERLVSSGRLRSRSRSIRPKCATSWRSPTPVR